MYQDSIPYKYHLRDSLTGALSRNTFLQLVDKEERNARRTGNSFTILCFEYDNIEEYLDYHTQQEYEKLLIGTVEYAQKAIRQIDRLGMYSKNIFSILLTETNKEGAQKFAPRFRNNIYKQDFTLHAILDGGQLTMSIGGSAYPNDFTKKMSIFENALMSLKKAHKKGGNRDVFFSI